MKNIFTHIKASIGLKWIKNLLCMFFLLCAMLMPASINAQTSVTIGTGTGDSYYPLPGYYGWQYDVYLYDAATITSAGNITSIAYNIISRTSGSGASFQLYMKDVPATTTLSASTNFSTYISGATLVYSNSSMTTPSTGWNTFTFTNQFCHTAGNSILVAIRGVGCGTSGGCSKHCYYTSTTGKHWYKHADSSDPGSSVSGTVDAERANIILTFNGTCESGGGTPSDGCYDFEQYTGVSVSSTGVMPAGWSAIYSGTSDAYAPHVCTGSYTPTNFTPGNRLSITASTSSSYGSTNYIVMPQCSNVQSVSFNAWVENSSYGTMSFGYLTNPTNGNTFVSLGNVTAPAYGSATLTNSLNNFTIPTSMPAGAYLAFRWTQTSTSTWYSAYIDNVCVDGDCGTDSPGGTDVDGCDYAYGNGTSCTYTYGPVDNWYNYSYRQIIYPASALEGGTINALQFNYCYTETMQDKDNVNIYLGHTTRTTFASTTDWIPISQLTLVYSGPMNCAPGWNTFTLNTPFEYDGTSNLVMAIDDNSGDYDGSSYTFYYTSGTGNTQIYYRSDTDNPNPSSPPTGTLVTQYPNTKFCINTCSGTEPIVSFANATLNINCGSTGTNQVTVTPNSGGTITYTSSNPSVATVNSQGVVTAVSTGTTTITVRVAANGNYCAATGSYTVNIVGTPHTLTYNTTAACSGTASAAPASVTGTTATVTTVVPTCSSATYFNGWNTAANGTGTSYSAGSTVNLGCENVTLYAQYSNDPPIITGSPDCETAMAFCASNDVAGYDLTVEPGDDSYPSGMCSYFRNATWWYLRISEPGPLEMTIRSSCGDVDFGCWGPFENVTCDITNDLNNAENYSYYSGSSSAELHYTNTTQTPTSSTTTTAICSTVALAEPSGNLVDFGGSTSDVEYLQIANAQVGQYYMVVIGNYANCSGDISFTQTNLSSSGSGRADCTIVNDCAITSITTLVSECNASGTFSISGSIAFNDAPSDGNLVISDGEVSQTFNPPFVSPISYSLSGIQGDGQEHVINAHFTSTSINCEKITYINAPDCVIECPDATVTMSGYTEIVDGIYYYDVCLGTGINMVGQQTGYTSPTWTWRINPHGGGTPTVLYGQSVSYTPAAEQGYDISLTVTSGDCSTVAYGRIRVSDGLDASVTSYDLGNICVGESSTVTIGATGSDIVVAGEVHDIETTLGQAGETFIPDGPNCAQGQCYTSSVTFYDFNDGDRVTSVDDINYVRINMEHSFIGDIQIKLTCPSGRSAIILQDNFSSDPDDEEHYNSQAIDPYTYTWPSSVYESVWFARASQTQYYCGLHMGGIAATSAEDLYPTEEYVDNEDRSYYVVNFVTVDEAEDFIENYLQIYYAGHTYDIYQYTRNGTVYYVIGYTELDANLDEVTYFVALTRDAVSTTSGVYTFPSQEAAQHFITLNWGGVGSAFEGHIVSHYNRIFFGEPDVYDVEAASEITASQICDGNDPHNLSGVGYDYAWTSSSSYNTVGYVYDEDNMSASSTIHDNGTESTSTLYHVIPSNVAARTQIYQPFQSFSNLIGCPLNGTWTISVCDSWKFDNGYIFNWELSLDENLLPDNWGYSVLLDDVSTNCGSIATVENNNVTVAPQAGSTGDYTCNITLIDNMGCEANIPFTYSVVEPTITHVSGSTDQTVCEDVAITDIVYTIGGAATSATATGLPAGVTLSISGNTVTVTGTPANSGTYNFTINTVSEGYHCTEVSVTGRIVVNVGNIVPEFVQAGPYCSGTTVDDLPTESTNNITGTWSPAITNSTNTYTFTPDAGQCATITTMIITVNEAPTLSYTSGSETLCKGVATAANIVFTYGGGANGASVSGLPAGMSFTVDNAHNTVNISGTPTAAGSFSYTVTTTGAVAPCTNATVTRTITVNDVPTLTLTSGSATQTICNGSAITDLVYTYGGSATGATATNLPAGLTQTLNTTNHTLTISGTPTAAGTLTVSTTGTPAPCQNTSLQATISINSTATLELVADHAADVVLCKDAFWDDDIEYTFGGSATGIDLAALNNSLPSGLTATVNGSVVTISGYPSDEGGDYQYVITTTGVPAPCQNLSMSGTISIVTDATLELTSADGTDMQEICLPGTFTNIVYTYGGGATGVDMDQLRAGLPAGLTATISPTTHRVTISGTPTETGEFNYLVSTIGVTAPCKNGDLPGVIKISQQPELNVTGATTQAFCQGNSIENMVFTYGGGATGVTLNGDLPAGVTATPDATAHTLTISGTPTETGTFALSVVTTGAVDPCTDVTIDASITIYDNPSVTISTSETQLCNGSSATLTADPATFNRYQWSCATASDATYTITNGMPTNVTASSISVNPTVTPGNTNVVYNLNVTDANGCVASTSQSISVSEIPTADISKTDNTKCTTPYNGTITVSNFAGGASNSTYTISVTGQTAQTSTGAGVVFEGLEEGTYTVRVTNSSTLNICYTEETITIGNNPSEPVVAISGSTSICENTSTSLTANVTGATGEVTYQWSNNTTQNPLVTPNLSSTTDYSVTVTDENGCTASDDVQVVIGNTPDVELVAVTNPICLGSSTVLQANVSNAGTGYTLQWQASPADGSGLVSSNTDRITVTPAAVNSFTYSVTLTANSCGNGEPYLVEDQVEVVVNGLPTAGITNNTNETTLTCDVTEISLTATGGNSYVWSNGVDAANNTISAPGTYIVTVTDANNCTAESQIVIDRDVALPNVAIAQPGATELTCTRTAIDLTASSTTAGAILSWESLHVTEPETYTVTATAPNGCQSTASIEITRDNNVPTVSITNNTGATTLTCALTQISVTAVGSASVESYSWNGGQTTSTAANTFVAAGTYIVTATASNGCEAVAQIIIDIDDDLPNVVITPSATILTCATQSITLDVSGAESYVWSNHSDEDEIIVTSTGTYSVTGTAANGCTNIAEVTIDQDISSPDVSISPATAAITCTNQTATLNASTTTVGATLSWTSQTVNEAGSYTVIATATNGCTSSAVATVSRDETMPTVSISAPSTQLTCRNDVITLTATGTGTLSWTTLDVTSAGDYSVETVADNGCTASDVIHITADFREPDIDIVNNTQTSILTCNVPSISVSVESDDDADSYSWSGGENTSGSGNAFTAPGTYYVTATAPNGCETINVIEITQNIVPPSVSITNNTGTTVLTCELDEISVTAVGSAAAPNAVESYLWSEGVTQTTADNTLVTIGTYVVTVTATNGCTATDQVIITESADRPTVNIQNNTGTTILTCATTEINVVATGTGVSYSWSGGSTPNAASNTISAIGTYSVIATGANGCTNVTSISITENLTPPSVSITNQSGFNEINCNAEVVNVVAAGNGVSYVWSNGANTAATSFTTEGTYSVTATANNGCTNSASVVITEDHTSPVVNITSANGLYSLDCTHRSLTLNATGGISFVWEGGQTTSSITVTTSGVYRVTATGTNGCTAEAFVQIEENLNPPAATIENTTGTTVLDCNTDGIHVVAQGGYQFAWNNALWGGGAEQTITAPGTYSVTVTSHNGCTALASITITANTIPPTVNVASTTGNYELNCNVSQIIVNATGNGVEYAWNGGVNVAGSSNTFTTPGTYRVTATGSNGCTSSSNVIITSDYEGPSVSINNLTGSTTIDCNTPQISVAVGGNGVSYLWNDNFVTASRVFGSTGTSPITYSVTVTGANGCTTSSSIVIQEDLALPVASITNHTGATELNCNTTSISLTANGGISYQWSNGSTMQNNTVFAEGNYIVTVTGANGCSNTASILIAQVPEFHASIQNIGTIECNGGTTSATVVVEGGNPGYYYNWSDGQSTPMATNLVAGTYSVTVRDSGGCSAYLQFSINQPEVLVASISAHDLYCGVSLGSLNAIVSGGTQPYSYSWSTGSTASVINDLNIGAYSLVVRDMNGCVANANAQVAMQGMLTVSAEVTHPISCHGYNDGIVMASCLTAVEPVRYSWNTGNVTAEIGNLFEGAYTVTVTDNWGCSGQASVSIYSPSEMEIELVTVAPKCHESTDGVISVSAMGGNAPYVYQWSNNAEGQYLDSISGGFYSLTISDATGCSVIKNIELIAPEAIAITSDVTDIKCYGDKNGHMELHAEGGTQPYMYAIDGLTDFSPVNSFNNMIAGYYVVRVADHNNCEGKMAVLVSQPQKLEVNASVENPFCRHSRTGKIHLTVTGGVEPYLYYWDNYRSDVPEMANIPEGEYPVGVIDDNGCVSEEKVVTLTDVKVSCLHIPNVFTPNGDGINDQWIIGNIEMFPDAQIYVFNRWGQMVYKAKGNDEPWTGELKNHFVPAGTYMYIIDLFNEEEPYEGTVTVLY